MLENDKIQTANSSLGKFKDDFTEGISLNMKEDHQKQQSKNYNNHHIIPVNLNFIIDIRYFSII